MQDKDTTKSTFIQLFNNFKQELFQRLKGLMPTNTLRS